MKKGDQRDEQEDQSQLRFVAKAYPFIGQMKRSEGAPLTSWEDLSEDERREVLAAMDRIFYRFGCYLLLAGEGLEKKH